MHAILTPYGQQYRTFDAVRAAFHRDAEFRLRDPQSQWDGLPVTKSELVADGYTSFSFEGWRVRYWFQCEHRCSPEPFRCPRCGEAKMVDDDSPMVETCPTASGLAAPSDAADESVQDVQERLTALMRRPFGNWRCESQ